MLPFASTYSSFTSSFDYSILHPFPSRPFSFFLQYFNIFLPPNQCLKFFLILLSYFLASFSILSCSVFPSSNFATFPFPPNQSLAFTVLPNLPFLCNLIICFSSYSFFIPSCLVILLCKFVTSPFHQIRI